MFGASNITSSPGNSRKASFNMIKLDELVHEQTSSETNEKA